MFSLLKVQESFVIVSIRREMKHTLFATLVEVVRHEELPLVAGESQLITPRIAWVRKDCCLETILKGLPWQHAPVSDAMRLLVYAPY